MNARKLVHDPRPLLHAAVAQLDHCRPGQYSHWQPQTEIMNLKHHELLSFLLFGSTIQNLLRAKLSFLFV
jgi:hypothetical protein